MVQGLVKIGKMARLHGTAGALLLQLEKGIALKKTTKVLFVRINGTPTPFFLSEVSDHGVNAIVAFDTIGGAEEARTLVGKEVLAEAKALGKAKEEKTLRGYKLVDHARGELGVVQEMMEMPGQFMFAVEIEGKEVLLPANEELIENIDHKKRVIFYKAPEGLIDIYLE